MNQPLKVSSHILLTLPYIQTHACTVIQLFPRSTTPFPLFVPTFLCRCHAWDFSTSLMNNSYSSVLISSSVSVTFIMHRIMSSTFYDAFLKHATPFQNGGDHNPAVMTLPVKKIVPICYHKHYNLCTGFFLHETVTHVRLALLQLA